MSKALGPVEQFEKNITKLENELRVLGSSLKSIKGTYKKALTSAMKAPEFHEGERNYAVYRSCSPVSYYSRKKKIGAFFVKIDEMGSKVVVKNSNGFSIKQRKDITDDFIVVNEVIKDMMISKDKWDRDLVKEYLHNTWRKDIVLKDKRTDEDKKQDVKELMSKMVIDDE